ncbi:MAG: acetyl-CoA carboxylase carboxyl transferase subunit alpha [Candidatus Neomarinimicrobiota bacterium]|nr:acetyl-CoA carboxylase carboxyltransferase subunit alpha [Candidatus Neomarinimicrobiota bacterium]MCD6100530.1 acetyl-CoA carboxylase carboxyltransferase subunit alpha [Candidatus Neomarinimicrobiota bacterium]RKY54461.1 MAG: acetyl-CoA carboxylase carboxyl transferase subunit alpha [Candidatus Neomarinimicrobiota bacterium]RLF44378.1 MAG: acetyl-CoA carboxylase carboxyl transferase subunit alpha [Thermoplasmata archaeon]HDN59160.1 acetyl-CoA carboxylase carboxyltransferase subunit alpha [C
MSGIILDFEKPIVELEKKIQEMKDISAANGMDLSGEIKSLEAKLEKLIKKTYSNLTRWQRVQLARHPARPYTLDYISRICSEFIEVHGDRFFGDDKAIVTGFGVIDDFKVVIIGQQKGRSTKENLYRNFGMPHPEGYRKALRVMKLAEKFNKPVISFIDTPGAYPGIGAEERGQAEAIARNLFEMSRLRVPILIVVIGEGASGGALGIGVGDRILVMENTWYSVISPEGCASILFRDASKAPIAAEAMKVTAYDLGELGIADEIIPEPIGGAHRDYDMAAKYVKETIVRHLRELLQIPVDELVERRIHKYGMMGSWDE